MMISFGKPSAETIKAGAEVSLIRGAFQKAEADVNYQKSMIAEHGAKRMDYVKNHI